MAKSRVTTRATALLAGAALVASGGLFQVQASAAPVLPSATIVDKTIPECQDNQATKLTVFNSTDFHGRIGTAKDLNKAARMFQPIEAARKAVEGSTNSFVLSTSSGDNIGGSTFESFVDDDKPTLEILKASGLEVYALGNHEFDRGMDSVKSVMHEMTTAGITMLGRNAVNADGSAISSDLKRVFYKDYNGVKVAVIGAVVEAVETQTAAKGMKSTNPWTSLKEDAEYVTSGTNDLDGDGTPDKAEFVIALVHDDVVAAETTLKGAPIDLVFGGHTHLTHNKQIGDQLFVQAGQYAEHLAKVELTLTSEGDMCGAPVVDIMKTAKDDQVTVDPTLPRIAKIIEITKKAVETADVKGAEVVAQATADFTRPAYPSDPEGYGKSRSLESTMSNLVADFLFDTLSDGDPEFIALQNPGGTRADLKAGDITYKAAAAILPFANILKTGELTGQQIVDLFNYNWQQKTPGQPLENAERPYLQMAVSNNVRVVMDETLPLNQRVVDVWVNGTPIKRDKVYRVGAGNFLVDSGKTSAPDNWFPLMEVKNVKDSGRVDLEAWVGWLKEKKTVSPDFGHRSFSVHTDWKALETALKPGDSFTVEIGKVVPNGLYQETLLMRSAGGKVPSFISAKIGNVELTKEVAVADDGSATLKLTIPADLNLDSIKDELIGDGVYRVTFQTRTVDDAKAQIAADGGNNVNTVYMAVKLATNATTKPTNPPTTAPTETPKPKPGIPSTGV